MFITLLSYFYISIILYIFVLLLTTKIITMSKHFSSPQLREDLIKEITIYLEENLGKSIKIDNICTISQIIGDTFEEFDTNLKFNK